MSKILSQEDFGAKLYKSLPPMYHVADADVNYALKRFLEALADGGFAKVIEEINGFLNLIDPDKIDEELLPILFKHYGFEAFNGIPTMYLRKLLPLISDIYNLKGTVTAVEYLTSVVSGVKSSVELSEEYEENHTINVNLEMNYGNSQNDMPDQDQLLRIIKEFVPFYCNVLVVYLYIFEELGKVSMTEREEDITIIENNASVINLLTKEYEEVIRVLYGAIEEKATFNTNNSFEENSCSDSLTNKSYNQSDGNFFYTNSIGAYDIIRTKGREKVDFVFITRD